MVQVIQLHPYKSCYPFGLQKDTQFTYVELIRLIKSELQLQQFKQNLVLFKSIESPHIIKLDSYIKQSNQLQLYYQYEPISLKMFIEQRLEALSDQNARDKFLNKIVNSINSTIDLVINVLMEKRLLAVLSIQNMAVAQGDRIKFFIDPDFEVVLSNNNDEPKSAHKSNCQQQKAPNSQINQYYQTEKKKLQIQLQQFLESIFNVKKIVPGVSKQNKKANFIIQGTKLVFVGDDQSARQSSMSSITNLLNSIKANTVMEKSVPSSANLQLHNNNNLSNKNSESSNNNNAINKPKFDIKNILDEKKLQKNQLLPTQISSTPSTITSHPQASQRQHKGSQTFQSMNDNTKESFNKNTTAMNDKEKQVKNYFQNNDDFNKDASFYPEEFIKEDSIAELDGYEDELQKQLQDLKNKKILDQQQQQTPTINRQAGHKNQKNRLSISPPQTIGQQFNHQNVFLQEQKMYKPVFNMSTGTNTFLENLMGHGSSNNTLNSKPNSTSNSTSNNIYTTSFTTPTPLIPNPHNTSNSSQNNNNKLSSSTNKNNTSNNKDSSSNNISNNSHNSQQQQNSTQFKQKKKYKVKITTSHLVDVEDDDVDLKDIEKQIIDDIRKGKLKHHHNTSGEDYQQEYYRNAKQQQQTTHNPQHIVKRQTHHPSSNQEINYNLHQANGNKNQCYKNTSLGNISPVIKQEKHYDNHTENGPFSKHHPHVVKQNGEYMTQQEQKRQISSPLSSSSSNHPPIHNNIQQQGHLNLNSNKSSSSTTQPNNYPNADIKKIMEKIKNNAIVNKESSNSSHHQNEEDHRPSSQLSSSSNSNYHHQHGHSVNYVSGQNAPGQLNSNNNSQQTHNSHDPSYFDKIQKAKMKAEEIMKLVKQRKVQ